MSLLLLQKNKLNDTRLLFKTTSAETHMGSKVKNSEWSNLCNSSSVIAPSHINHLRI